MAGCSKGSRRCGDPGLQASADRGLTLSLLGDKWPLRNKSEQLSALEGWTALKTGHLTDTERGTHLPYGLLCPCELPDLGRLKFFAPRERKERWDC